METSRRTATNLPHLSTWGSKKFKKAKLDRTTYSELLRRWIAKGGLSQANRTRLEWRKELCEQLKSGALKSKTLILYGHRDKRSLRNRLADAENDPLFFINQLGIPPFEILSDLEKAKSDMETYGSLEKKLKNKIKRTANSAVIRKAARLLRQYENCFSDQLADSFYYSRNTTRLPHHISDGLLKIAEIIENPWKGNLLPPWTEDRKGGKHRGGAPSNAILRKMFFYLGGNWPRSLTKYNIRGESASQQIKWGSMAAITICAFPEIFTFKEDADESKNAIRIVKDGYKQHFNERQPISADKLRQLLKKNPLAVDY